MTEDPDKTEGDGQRDPETGRWAKGNTASKGNPSLKRIHALRALARQCADEERIVELFDAMHKAAVAGDTAAARVWCEFTLGKPAPASEPVSLELPEITSAESAVACASALLAALSRGEVTPEDASRVGGIVAGAVRAIELHVLEARVAELERAAYGAGSPI